MELEPHEWSVVIAVGTVIVVPLTLTIWKKLRAHYREAQEAKMAERLRPFVTRQEVEMQFDTLTSMQIEQHAENQKYLDTIRTEALRREEKLSTLIKEAGASSTSQNDRIRGEVHAVNQRVDSVLQMLGDRRQRPRN